MEREELIELRYNLSRYLRTRTIDDINDDENIRAIEIIISDIEQEISIKEGV